MIFQHFKVSLKTIKNLETFKLESFKPQFKF